MYVRSILFYLLLSAWTLFLGIVCIPYLFLPSVYLRQSVRLWIKGIFFLLKNICNITHEIRGLEHIPSHSVLVVSKHQSAFETFALFYYIPKSLFIHKKQLFWIPIFGQYLKKINMISIDRAGGATTMRAVLKKSKRRVSEGFSIIIFPEGTRKKPGADPDYKSGFTGIYKEIQTPILPVAVNSGYCWPKHTFIKKPGHIIIQIMKSLPANLERIVVLKKVQKTIEDATNKII